MLLVGHIGYTVGAVWATESLTHRDAGVDYRAVALMSVAPDIVDRALFILALPNALNGRLIAHTLVFQLVLFLLLILARRSWWLYGAASIVHLLLDSPGHPLAWARQVFWPLFGTASEIINIAPGSVEVMGPYQNWIWLRMQQSLEPYTVASGWDWLLELGGALVLLAFAYRKTLYRIPQLRQFLTAGRV